MSFKQFDELDLYLNDDFVITKSSPIFDKKRGAANKMFYPRDLDEILAMRDGESICVDLASGATGVAIVKRTDDGYLVRHIGITGELYSILRKREIVNIDEGYYRPSMHSARTKSHFVEMIRIVNSISSAVYRPYNLSDAPVYRVVDYELRHAGFEHIFRQKGFVCACVSERQYNLMVAASTACCASFARNNRISTDLYKLDDLAVYSTTVEFGGSEEDRKAINSHSFGSEHSDLAMLEMMCANIDWQFICGFEGLDDRILHIGFAIPVAKVPLDRVAFLSPDQPLSEELEHLLGLQFEYDKKKSSD